MRDYGLVVPQYWTGHTGRQIRRLGRDAQVVSLYLLTNPSANMIGLYYLPLPTLCHETGLPLQGALKALRSLSEAHFATYQEDLEVVWVHEMARFQIGEALSPRDKRCKGIWRELLRYKNTPFFKRFYDRYRSAFCLPPLDDMQPHRSPSEAPSESHQSQDQEQEHDQDQDQEQDKKNEDSPLPPSVVNGADTRATPEWVIDRWNAIPGVEPLQLKYYTPHAGVGKKLTTRLSERKSKAWWEGFFDRVQQSTWLLDEYHPCLDWALGPQNMQKILQGNYVKTVKAKPKTAFGKLMHELGEASTESQAYTIEGGPS